MIRLALNLAAFLFVAWVAFWALLYGGLFVAFGLHELGVL